MEKQVVVLLVLLLVVSKHFSRAIRDHTVLSSKPAEVTFLPSPLTIKADTRGMQG